LVQSGTPIEVLDHGKGRENGGKRDGTTEWRWYWLRIDEPLTATD
jgi:hypothetical protein